MLRGPSVSLAARCCALLSVACLPTADTASSGRRDAPREYVEASTGSGPTALPTVRWITESTAERRIDVFAFDCARGRYAHVLSERYRGTLRVERVALAEARWAAALQPLPPKYPVLAVHRARSIVCAPVGTRR